MIKILKWIGGIFLLISSFNNVLAGDKFLGIFTGIIAILFIYNLSTGNGT